MFLVENYILAIAFCFITMLCWGSWANTQKLAGKTWRYELFYWDYVFGVVLTALLFAVTLGNNGGAGRGFIADLQQAEFQPVLSAFIGGVVFNIANILLVAAIAIAGMSVAFPVGIGLALVLGVLINFIGNPAGGNAVLLFSGVGLVAAAIILNAVAYKKLPGQQAGVSAKGLILSVLCGILMSLFYFFVAQSLAQVRLGEELVSVTAENLSKGTLEAGKLTPYTANFIFTLGILLSNFIVNTAVMMKPFVGTPVPLTDYFKGRFGDHIWGIVGGAIWAAGMTLNVIAANVASPAVAYGLGQGATLVSAVWGVFIWQEFRNAPKGTSKLLAAMFICFIAGLGLLIFAKL
ncbi:multidrug DMT transporter permease [Planctomycetales bacterium]|nr:multidrug DMT transporter permease [Planctomycetales bacterium]